MRRLRDAASAAVVAVAVLAGCTAAPTAPPEITVTGEVDEAPTLTYVTPLDVDSTYREQIWPGTGAELVEGGPVLIDFWLENGTDASLVDESFSSTPTPRLLTAEDLGTDLYETLRDQRVGARVLQVSPGRSSGAAGYPTVTVLDVLPTRADGSPVPPAADLPPVTLDAAGMPTMTPTGTEPPDRLVVQPLLRGAGPQVAAQDVITVQYEGFVWTTGASFDSTWSRGLPVSFALQDVPAWAEGLVDQPVGSQVMLVVPPTYALGVTESEELAGQTVVFVVDILATGSPDGGSS
ncbi:FKBP-type peptidyl-prolyl cis-trans isomerase [Cellulomonas fimi]|uniref:Peptidyl-prolyl cis-trans isomerase n=1 Tax=Cellulomonas fimi (strain ATCC 484 / DSM 20113 / JCM 1341 / CCUG 24087 / LMG 16345 / NBRC 15513 / NCIMB 8980 / NCTC 7547 / NRS-133) TaxID=590998 RepID=F4GYD6_CELFA|nr:FKBP-type peptidyl-prolyl cis-trans isomerase [Cellulomonas fimi]AEE45925.1 peptidylprolyl isomerase FKBP-type [Cellulomonas fimi ATCC 484]VEH31020.1 FK506-binding protein [Cellulomonas fimi]